MKRPAARLHNLRVIVATSAGLVILVVTALTWLGWRLLTQEETLARQQTRDRLEQTADVMLAGFLRRMTETEASLSRMGATLPPDALTQPARDAGTMLIALTREGIDLQAKYHLLYYPFPPSSDTFDPATFEEAERFEFQAANLKSAATTLMALTSNKDPQVRAEALLRLARVQSKNRQPADAFGTYEKLIDETTMSPVGAPYGLLSRLARIQLLLGNREGGAQQEAAQLVEVHETGQWKLSKESYVYYNTEARKLVRSTKDSPALETRLAAAEIVETLWDEWQLFQHSGSRSITKHLHNSARVPLIAALNANPERLVAFIYPGAAIQTLCFAEGDNGVAKDIQLSVTDENGRTILGSMHEGGGIIATRTLSAVELPWRFDLAVSPKTSAGGFVSERRNFYIVVLAAVVLLVSIAGYAITRGVLREAAAGRLQSDFVSAVSHEFRSPLTTLRQLTEILAEGRMNDESRRRLYFNVLQKETARLHQLVEDLLDFGRIDAGRRQYRIEPINFSELVRDGVHEYRIKANGNDQSHRIELNCKGAELLVNADREALRCVVRNLVENAVKYSPNSEVVWVETDQEDRDAVLRVRDDGMGIPPEEQSRIFEKFVRGEAAKQACIQGTGIGLAMVKEIVRVHHGEVDVRSEVGRGSTFRVRLPLMGVLDRSWE